MASKRISFAVPAPVYMWDAAITKVITLPDTLEGFNCQVRAKFDEELDDCDFRVYTLPSKHSPVEKRALIDGDTKYSTMKEIVAKTGKIRVLIFKFEDKSPIKVPLIWQALGTSTEPPSEILPKIQASNAANAVDKSLSVDPLLAKQAPHGEELHTIAGCRHGD